MGCLAEVLRGSGYSVLNGEAVPLFPGKTPDKDGAALMASNRENKRVLDDVKFQVLADAPVLSPEQKADIELAFENEISIDDLIINQKLIKVLPPLALPVRAPEPAEPPSSNFPVIPKSLTIHSVAEIDALLALIKQAWHPDPDRFDGGLATFAPSSGTI
ncbi:hypothetical protein RIR_jg15566.t1 [Rhizophagus irregularis DAOM 181602=DAOM 197198]|nr:hypothetical protein RIR_jg15566.t1 [Rhizophagus irregularis DAOM 181602=DAOM 197198]